jgi:hypothetical protein
MTDPIRFDRSPSAAFADRLERDLLRAVGTHPARTVTTTAPRQPTTSEEDQLMTIDLKSGTPGSDQRPRASWKWLALAAAVIALVVAVAAILPGRRSDNAAADRGSPVTFVVKWAYSEVKSDCPPPSHECLNHFDIPASAGFTGDVRGDGVQALYWNNSADYPGQSVDHLEHVGTYLVAATVRGCGTGKFMLVELMQFVSGADRDRDTGTYKGTWQIVEGSGRDALRNVAGSGTSTGVFGKAGDEGRTFTGSISCPAD